jgi:ferritin-like metal-binding protein YciE
MAKQKAMRDLLLEELRDLYDAERQLTKALPKLARAATSDDLREALESHKVETEGHLEKLETVFEALGERARGKRCPGIAGIVEEGSELIDEDFDGAVMDAGIIAGAQRAEHYEMGAYGSVIAWANALGQTDIVPALEEILEQEKAADQKLTELAEGSINAQAAAQGGDEGGEDEEEEDEDERGRRATATSGAGGRSSRGRASTRRR